MMAVIFGVANGGIKIDRVYRMFSLDNKEMWTNLNLAPPDGLTLSDIEFKPEVMSQATDLIQELPVGPPPDPGVVSLKKIDW